MSAEDRQAGAGRITSLKRLGYIILGVIVLVGVVS